LYKHPPSKVLPKDGVKRKEVSEMRRMVSVLMVVALLVALVAASAVPAFAGEQYTKKGSPFLGFIDSESNFFIDQEGNLFIDSESNL
jgi:hypothetical protein